MAQSFTAMDVKLATPVTKVVNVAPSMIGEKDSFFIIASPTDGNARVMLSPLGRNLLRSVVSDHVDDVGDNGIGGHHAPGHRTFEFDPRASLKRSRHACIINTAKDDSRNRHSGALELLAKRLGETLDTRLGGPVGHESRYL
jgi:hypothetical protein